MLWSCLVDRSNESADYLPEEMLVCMLRNDGWSGVDGNGWISSVEKGKSLNVVDYVNVKILYRISLPSQFGFNPISVMYELLTRDSRVF